jgi:Methylase involved in ubiquinone/menaquinone biosynthesis
MEPFYDVRNSYQGVEDIENFKSGDELESYKELCLKKSKPQADFMEKIGCIGNKTLEIGCGNGRLLFELKRRGLIDTATGMDVSESRIIFANAWCKDLKMISNLKFEVGDVTHQPLYGNDFDLIICITSAVGLVAPLVEDGDKKMLAWLIKQASPNAKFIFEVFRYPLELAICKQANGGW